jgi:hypothetical protein
VEQHALLQQENAEQREGRAGAQLEEEALDVQALL